MRQRRLDNSTGIFLMWWYWTLSTGILISIIVLSLWVKPTFLPIAALLLDLILFVIIRRNRRRRVPACYLLPFICSKALFMSAIVMAVINLLYSHWFIEKVFDLGTINKQIPFITQLIIGPCTLVVALWTQMRGSKLGICRNCKIRNGSPAERGFLGQLFAQEGRFQNHCLIYLSLFATIVAWIYYCLMYANDEFIITDKLVFVWCAVVLYLISVLYAAIHYISLWSYYCRKEENIARSNITMTQLRYIIFCDGCLALVKPKHDADGTINDDDYYDTPIKIDLSFRENITHFDAINRFVRRTSIKDADLRFMYSTLNTNADCNIFHYFCFLNEEQKEEFEQVYPDTEWCNLITVAKYINTKQMAPLMSAEIIRLHTMAMAWKTYDEQGFRKYKIKHYHPSFRFKDIPKYDIDYNDPKWLYIADNNEDKPFFRIRRLWRKYFSAMTE